MIYLLHFSSRFRHAAHYIGYCEDGKLEERLDRHRRGHGATLLKHVFAAGIKVEVVRTWKGDRDFERRLKKMGSACRICPICSPKNQRAIQA